MNNEIGKKGQSIKDEIRSKVFSRRKSFPDSFKPFMSFWWLERYSNPRPS